MCGLQMKVLNLPQQNNITPRSRAPWQPPKHGDHHSQVVGPLVAPRRRPSLLRSRGSCSPWTDLTSSSTASRSRKRPTPGGRWRSTWRQSGIKARPRPITNRPCFL